MLSEKLQNFDPNGAGQSDGGLFGLPFTPEEARVVVLPVPWEVTVSYAAGTADGPEAIRQASTQIDLYDEDQPEIWKMGLAMTEPPAHWREKSEVLRKQAARYIAAIEAGEDLGPFAESLNEINESCSELMWEVEQEAGKWLEQGKKVAVLGGDHSTPLGLIRALARRYDSFGILQIDAHADLRVAYEGFEYSHASIMHNALQIPQVARLTQVGIRDYCEAEAQYMQESARISVFTGRTLLRSRFQANKSWAKTCQSIVETLPDQVYVSFDIDGLEPWLCPHTGTPVPGGLGFEEALFLIETVVQTGREIIGLDLNEVAPGPDGDEWDANVGARLLYRMCNLMGISKPKIPTED